MHGGDRRVVHFLDAVIPSQEATLPQWQYLNIDLNQLPRGRDEVDVLCDAGEEGWELVAILANNVAYLKRELDEMASDTTAPSTGAGNDNGWRWLC